MGELVLAASRAIDGESPMNGLFALRIDGETSLLAGAAGGEIFADVVDDAACRWRIRIQAGIGV